MFSFEWSSLCSERKLGGPKGPALPLISKDACDLYKPYAVKEVQDEQAQRDYVDNQYVFYRSVAEKIYNQLAPMLQYEDQKYKHYAVEALADNDRQDIENKVSSDLKSTLFVHGYLFCPAGSEAFTPIVTKSKNPAEDEYDEKNRRVCKPGPDWKQVNNYPPYGVRVGDISFTLNTDDQGKSTPKIAMTLGAQDQGYGSFIYTLNNSKSANKMVPFTGLKELTGLDELYNGFSISPNQFSVDSILGIIWPYQGTTPAPSQRPDEVLKGLMAAKGCEIYEADDKPVTATRAKILDERKTQASGGTGKTVGIITP